MLRTGGADFIVAQKGSADLTFSTVSQKDWDAVAESRRRRAGDGRADEREPDRLEPVFRAARREARAARRWRRRRSCGEAARAGRADEVMLGRRAASDLGADVGDTVTLLGRRFTVVGVYRGEMPLFDGGAYAPLDDRAAR